MDLKDATNEVVDTSDTEEREVLEAKKPGYYQRIWGSSADADDLQSKMMPMEVDSCEASSTLSNAEFAQLEPHTPSYSRRKPHVSSDTDPSPVFSRLQISPQYQAPSSSTPATTPIHSTSNSESQDKLNILDSSSLPSSSPLGALHEGQGSKSGSNLSEARSYVGDCDVHADFSGTEDPILLLVPPRTKKRVVDNLVNGLHDGNCDAHLNASPTHSASSALHTTPQRNLSYSGPLYHSRSSQKSSSPPLEFPYSPGPDLFSQSPARSDINGASQDTISLLNHDDQGMSISKPTDAILRATYHADLVPETIHNALNNDSLDAPSPPPDPVLGPRPGPLFSPARSLGCVEPEQGMLRFMSPLTPPPPEQPLSHRTSATPSPEPLAIIPPDPNPPGRAYSLRQRSAKQINPFEYDQRMYKHQLKGVPEAIVKNPTAGREGKRKERYREGSEERQDWNNDEEADDGDEEWRKERERGEKQKQKEATTERMRKLGLVMSSSEEEDLIEVGGTKGVDLEKRTKKRRKVAARKFPMAIESGEPKASSSSPGPVLSMADVPAESFVQKRPRPRPRPVFHRPSLSPSPPVRSPSVSASAGPAYYDFNFNLDAGMNDGLDLELGMDWPNAHDKKDGPVVVDDSDNMMVESTRGRSGPRCGDEGEDESDVQMLDSADEENPGSNSKHRNSDSRSSSSSSIEMTEKDRKRLKALSRMMPAAHRKKLLQTEQEKARHKDKSRLHRQEDSQDEDVSLQPGRGRRRLVSPSSRDPKRYEIKGDTETETESPDDATPKSPEIIVVDDDTSEEDAERLLEESDDGIDNDDIQTWLSPGFANRPDRESTPLPNAPRTRRPDHERDRPRGGDLIDRMLQRTRRVGPRERKNTKKRKPENRGPRNPMLNIVTGEAQRHGAGGGRQTKLAFPKAEGTQGTSVPTGSRKPKESPSIVHHQEHHIESRQNGKNTKKKKAKSGLVQTHLHVFPANGRKIISGRGRQYINIDKEDEAFHEALAPAGHYAPPQTRRKRMDTHDVVEKFRSTNAGVEPDTFATDTIGGQGRDYVTLDFDIPLLPSGISIGSESYMGKGRLYDLLSILEGKIEPARPPVMTVLGQQIEPDVPMTQFSPLLAAACDQLYDASTTPAGDPEMHVTAKAAEAMMHSLCHMISFRAFHADGEEYDLLAAALVEQSEHLVGRINTRLETFSEDGHFLDYRSFALYWLVVELHLRLSYAHWRRIDPAMSATSPTTYDAERYAVLLLRRLLEYGLYRTTLPLQTYNDPLDLRSSDVRTLELWTCILHLAPLFRSSTGDSPPSPPSFWRLVEAAMEVQSNKPDSQLDASERIWRTLFSLCAVSQFSPHGLTTTTVRLQPYWPIVLKALKSIRLSADEQLDHSKPASTLQKRDTYVRLITARCFLLCARWSWRLDGADVVFHELCAIFRSRNFSNLLGERPDFPAFIRDRNESLFHVYKKNDTAFGLFLKLIIRAAKDFPDTADTRRTRNVKLVKLLSLAVPVGSTSFTKSSPPLGQDLSMLYNRYSAIIVAVYLDSTPTSIRTRLQQVRRYINFKDADCNSRAASIRAMMTLAILFRHRNLPPDEVLSWASDMMIDLVDNYGAAEKALSQPQVLEAMKNERDQVLLSIQLLIGSIRIVIETPTMNLSESIPAKYPDSAFLQGAWINRVFTPACSLDGDRRTGLEICKCVQSFLNARSAIIPPPPLPSPQINQQGSLESQDEYGDGGLDLNDPAVLAILNGLDGGPDETSLADARAAEIIDQSVSTSIYRLVCKHFSSEFFESRLPGTSWSESDRWVDCWLGCASVVVLNKRRDWTWYFDLGRAAWDSIRDRFWRRRMCLKFMLSILHLDAPAYSLFEDRFVETWFQCIVSPAVTIEHEFTARLLLVDSSRHFLFKNIPHAADSDTHVYTIGLREFDHNRTSLIDTVLCNIAKRLEDPEVAAEAVRYIPMVEKMLGTLREYFESMNQNEARRSKYAEFCKNILPSVRKHPTLMQEHRLREALNWGGF